MFPYDTEKSWGDYSLTRSLMSTSLNITLTGWPYLTKDGMTQKMSENFGTKEIVPSINQILTVYVTTPIVSFTTVLKKIFLSLDVKTADVYPLHKFRIHTDFYLFSFFNYFIILTSFYIIGNKKIRNKFFTKKELSIYGLVSLFLAPSLIFTVEWRYFILNYLILYSIFCFKYFDFLKEKEFDKNSYLKFILFFICISFLISSSYHY